MPYCPDCDGEVVGLRGWLAGGLRRLGVGLRRCRGCGQVIYEDDRGVLLLVVWCLLPVAAWGVVATLLWQLG